MKLKHVIINAVPTPRRALDNKHVKRAAAKYPRCAIKQQIQRNHAPITCAPRQMKNVIQFLLPRYLIIGTSAGTTKMRIEP
jgi:hypothetical protein